MARPKIVALGIGSHSFGMRTYKDLFHEPRLAGIELWLVDIDRRRLDVMTVLAKRLNAATDMQLKIHATTDRRRALPDADYVISSIATDRNDAWVRDRRIAEKHGVFQPQGECSGPGGLSLTLRNLPPYMEICRDMERLCPNALLINFSNPEGRVVLGVSRYSRINAVGLCHGLRGSLRWIAGLLGKKPDSLDAYPALRRAVRKLRKKQDALAFHLFETFGLYPIPGDRHLADFVPYVCRSRKLYKRYNVSERPLLPIGHTAPFEKYDRHIQRLASGAEPLDEILAETSGEAAIDIVCAHWFNENRYEIAVNVPNEGYIPNLPDGPVVEVPALVSGAGVQGVCIGALPEPIAAILRLQLTIQELAVDAAVTGDKQKAVQSLALDPMVGSIDAAEKIVDDLLKTHRHMLPQFFAKSRRKAKR